MAILHDFQHALAIARTKHAIGGIHKAIVHQRPDNQQLRQHQQHRPHEIRGVQVQQAIIYRTHKEAHHQAHQREIGHAAAKIIIVPFRAVGKAQSSQKL